MATKTLKAAPAAPAADKGKGKGKGKAETTQAKPADKPAADKAPQGPPPVKDKPAAPPRKDGTRIYRRTPILTVIVEGKASDPTVTVTLAIHPPGKPADTFAGVVIPGVKAGRHLAAFEADPTAVEPFIGLTDQLFRYCPDAYRWATAGTVLAKAKMKAPKCLTK